MKFISKYIFLISVIMFSLTGCADDTTLLGEQLTEEGTSSAEDDGMVEVTLSFSLDPSVITKTRDGESGETDSETVFGLEDLDIFIYVLRDENNNILWQYGKGFIGFDNDYDINDSKDLMLEKLRAKYPAFLKYNYQDDNNQTLMHVKWIEETDEKDNDEANVANVSYKMQENIKLRVMRGTKFKFSCWTQSSQTTAYDFNYLTALKVNYENMIANNEINDAFCATSHFSIGQMDTNLSVMLTRPFAQINIAIDEETIGQDHQDRIPIGTSVDDYKYSQIKLNGIAKAFDVIRNQVWTPENIRKYRNRKNEEDSPYANYSDRLFNDIPNEEDVISEFQLPYSPLPGFEEIKDNDGKVTGMKGELDELTIYDFSNWGPNSETDVPRKTYKKLAMAYVLVPDAESDETTNKTNSNIQLESFHLSKDSNGKDVKTFEPKDEDDNVLNISVKRNWRTNLLFTNWDWVNQ